jgi:sugar-specific transcriptional regulator TrmB
LNTLRTAEAELKVIQDKGLSNQVFNDPERFYSWEKEKIRNARKSVLAVTDRWMLVLMRAKDDIQYAVSKGVTVRVLGRIEEPGDNDMSRKLEQRAQSLMEAGAEIRILKGKIRIRFLVIDGEQVFFAVRKPGSLHSGTWILSPDFAKNFVDEHEEIWSKAEEPEGKFCYID